MLALPSERLPMGGSDPSSAPTWSMLLCAWSPGSRYEPASVPESSAGSEPAPPAPRWYPPAPSCVPCVPCEPCTPRECVPCPCVPCPCTPCDGAPGALEMCGSAAFCSLLRDVSGGDVMPPPASAALPLGDPWCRWLFWSSCALALVPAPCPGGGMLEKCCERSGVSSAFCRFSASRSSLKYGWRSAWRADSRSSGLYASSLTMRSTHSGDTWGMSLATPVPSFDGKLKSMCADRFFILASSSGGGVPRMLWIFCIWSSSLVPGNSGKSDTISKNTHPTPHMSIL
mmetsp:Transcript_35106/g.88899  ORF Transcript_35106/g.88899 Transcript_35106/m.88899 type:complete len:285 (-) Transcript_35106:406-1260(-)